MRAYLDTQFNAPVQTELLDARGRVLRTLSLVELQKVGAQYIAKSIDLRIEATRDKTRFQVTGAALGLEFAGPVFTPAGRADGIAPPEPGKIEHIVP